MKNNLISVIVPVYNLENYIKRCLKSIQNQTYRNIEIIVVDDGSKDDSWNVIKRIAKEDDRIIPIHKENGGVSSARMLGLANANGEWIGFVDGDDEIEEDMYEVLLNNAFEYNADISHCGYQMIFSDNRVNFFYNTGNIVKQDNTTGIIDLLEGTYIEPGLCNKLFRKKLFAKLLNEKIVDNSIKINEDLLMNYILFSQANLSVFQDVCKYHYIVRENSATRVILNENKIFDPIKVKQIILENSNKKTIHVAQKAYMCTCINVYNSLMIDRSGSYLYQEKVVRKKIIMNKPYVDLLNKKQKFLAFLILYLPGIYKSIYRFYSKYLLKSKYD